MVDTTTRPLRKWAGWLALAVLGTFLFGALALWLTDRDGGQRLESFDRILQAVDATRLAQVHFNSQLQEWKNVLLRGQEPADYERHLGQFHTQSAQTIDHLNRAAALSKELGLDAADVTAALAEHEALSREYQEALHGYRRGDVDSVFAVDASMREREGALDQRIDAIADAMAEEANRRMGVLAQQDDRRYRLLQTVFLVLCAGTLVLAGWLVALTLRR